MFGRDSYALIPNLHADFITASAAGDQHASAMRIGERVVDQIAQDHFEQFRIVLHDGVGSTEAQANVAGAGVE